MGNYLGLSVQEEVHIVPEQALLRLQRVELTEDNQETVQEYFKVKDRIERYMKPEHRMQIHIQSIERIQNPMLDTRLQNTIQRLHKNCQPELLIHGTTRDSAERIIKDGFKVGQGGMFGAGIYFATDSTKSAQYCRDDGVKYLLVCEVALGRTMVCTTANGSLNSENVTNAGYDSVFARRKSKTVGGVINDEYIVYRAEQAAPRYLVKFQRSENPEMIDKAVQCNLGSETSQVVAFFLIIIYFLVAARFF